jgi:multiple sugar transport system ATP-binding protein
MNFFDVELDESGETPVFTHDGFTYEIPEGVYADIEGQGDRFTLGIRPEDIELAAADEHNAVTTIVEVTEPLGEVTYVYLDIGGEQYTATLSGDFVVDPGRTLTVTFPEDRIHIFDAQTGEAHRNREPPEEDEAESLIGLQDSDGVGVGAE